MNRFARMRRHEGTYQKQKDRARGGRAVLSGSDLVLSVTPGGESLAKAIRPRSSQ
jgi:hypothetical protein